MSIKILDNTIQHKGGEILLVPENCEFLKSGKSVEICNCKINLTKENQKTQIIKSIYGILLSENGKVYIQKGCLKAEGVLLYLSGDIEKTAKSFIEFCNSIYMIGEIDIKTI